MDTSRFRFRSCCFRVRAEADSELEPFRVRAAGFRAFHFRVCAGSDSFTANAIPSQARIYSEPDHSELGSDFSETERFRARLGLIPSLANPS